MKKNKSSYQLEIIYKVKELRLKHNVSQMSLAEMLSISNGQIGNIESYKYPHKYTLKQLSCIADNFNIPIESLFLDGIEDININNLIKRIIEYDE